MFENVNKHLVVVLILLAAFLAVNILPAVAWILAGLAAFILFFFKSREAIFLYALYFSFEETFLLHCPQQFLVLMKYLGDILILALFFGTFAKLAIRKYNLSSLEYNKIHIPIFLFLVSAIISILLNQTPAIIAFVSLRQLLRYVVLFYAIILTAEAEWTRDDLKNLARMVIVLILIQAVIGYFQVVAGPGSSLNLFLATGNQVMLEGVPITGSRQEYALGVPLFGTMINPNTYGLFLACGLCLLAGLYFVCPDKDRRLKLLGLLLLIAIPLMKTYSRQSIYAAMVGITVIGFIRREFKVILAVLITIGFFSYYLTQLKGGTEWSAKKVNLAQRIVSPFSPEYRKTYGQADRLYSLSHITPKLLSSSYSFFGVGPGGIGSSFGYFLRYFEGYKKLEIPADIMPMVHTGTADIGFLAILGQYGIIGFVCFYSIFVTVFWFLLTGKLSDEDPFLDGITLGVLGYTMALLISNIGYSNFTLRQISFYFWLLAGITCTARRVKHIK
ncbi:MAG: hypothetical protein HY877_04095 [Deltaproteobacteria bacterium]|nr:hypothetical protein [Deltaproteobacteria bacterium]